MDEMTEGTRLIAAEILWRLAAGAVGGLFVSAAAFKLLSRGNFEEWLARLMDRRMSREIQWLAALGITVEMVLGAALLLRPAHPVFIVSWWFCLFLSFLQLLGWARKVGPCACFGASAGSQGAMLGPAIAPGLLIVVSALVWSRPANGQPFLVSEGLMLAGAALAIALTLLILIEAPRRIRELKVHVQDR